MPEVKETEVEVLQPQSADTPELKRPKNPVGRPRKDSYKKNTQAILEGTAPEAARLLSNHVYRKRGQRTLKPSLQRACEYVIDHAIGKARQKVEHSGGIMTYRQLADSAHELDKKPRDILADVEEIANKYKEGGPAEDTSSPSSD
jgi:hypothetical protein